MIRHSVIRSLALALAFAGAGATSAQEAAAPSSALKLDLNAVEPSNGGCRMTFVVENAVGKEITKAAYEIALFDKEGRVSRLMVLDFQALPAGKTKVKQFDLKGADCGNVGRVLINDATACEGDGIEPAACIRQLETSAKSGVQFGT
ncbi:hypothetical protein L598_000100001900 [Mesorhizobium sp. J18]|uniref:hypothetical protein n=1 Tax=Mesorhizobium sp. J18 TaxID=935263 RepID=UPI0011998C3B|nr:hypothetical protein [Mesorhizobium sp. J18]TWH01209.1 hypothetical protein L598_000100001900 [Mesorhizobium sp. J18]